MPLETTILRKKHSLFIYRTYSYKINKNGLELTFYFKMTPNINFTSKILIRGVTSKHISQVEKDCLKNIIFHIGLIEILSYWKVACSPRIRIEAGYLDNGQIKWWKDLLIKGLGQFFFENKIDFTEPGFLSIEIVKKKSEVNVFCPRFSFKENGFLVPLGGGRDSIVVLEKLKRKNKTLNVLLVNPSKVADKVTNIGGIKNPIIIERKIDPLLIKLNQKGYLNGHTPFTALLSFLSVLAAFLFGYKNIVFANEKSANEGNVRYKGLMINHQWSKSFEFEKKFKNYCKKFLLRNVNYFSLLRPYTELEISKMFCRYPQYFPVFSSCNKAQKKSRRWCGVCPKCLFVYATLYPFLDFKDVIKIFKKDIFENKKLVTLMKKLIGESGHKPFECVGTKKENILAFSLCLKKAKKMGRIPYLLYKFSKIMSKLY